MDFSSFPSFLPGLASGIGFLAICLAFGLFVNYFLRA